jgi:hypothetical protein
MSTIGTLNLDHLVGQQVGTAVLMKTLGRGAMSVVFMAFQKTLKRQIAVKILPKSMLTEKTANLFQQEAKSAAILAHPHIIPVYEVGETKEFLFFTMQLVKGNALSFLELFSDINKYGNAEGFKKAIFARGVSSIKVNHVRYQKITEDDEVISRDALKEMTPQMLSAEEEAKTRKMFLDTLLESILSEEFAKTLNIEALMANPGAVSKNMIQADLEYVSSAERDADPGAGSGAGGHGNLLFQQLEVMRVEVEKHLTGNGSMALADLAGAIFDMKKELLEGIEVQKTLGVAYENESAILENADELTDRQSLI